MTRAGKKEHEFILAADVDARHIHTALEAASAKAGKPVVFAPAFRPPTGSRVRVSLRYDRGGKKVTCAPGEWVREAKTQKPHPGEWVFVGSRFGPNPEGEDKPRYYMANHGDLICLCNIETAMLDVPSRSPKAMNQRLFEAVTDKIPPVGTPVEVILEVVPRRSDATRSKPVSASAETAYFGRAAPARQPIRPPRNLPMSTPAPRPTFPWGVVLCLVGLDYFSSLAYLPSIATSYTGKLAPLAALAVVLITLGAAVPVYWYVVGRSSDGRGGIGLLERLRRAGAASCSCSSCSASSPPTS